MIKPMKTYTGDNVSAKLKPEINEAQAVAKQSAFPRSKNTKVGCVLVTPNGNYYGANIKRWSWNNNTCSERMAIDKALFDGIERIDRFVIYAINQEKPSSEPTAPCGPCREIIRETLTQLNQPDVDFIMVNADKTKVVEAKLSELLPLSPVNTE